MLHTNVHVYVRAGLWWRAVRLDGALLWHTGGTGKGTGKMTIGTGYRYRTPRLPDNFGRCRRLRWNADCSLAAQALQHYLFIYFSNAYAYWRDVCA